MVLVFIRTLSPGVDAPSEGYMMLKRYPCLGSCCLSEGTREVPPEEESGMRASQTGQRFRIFLCIILGALLFLVLVILGIQLHRWRAEHQALSAFEDAVDEGLYQEIDDLIKPEKEDLLDSPGHLSDDSVTRLPYYTGDTEEDGDPEYAPEPRGEHVNATGNGYDDVEELPVPEIPFSPGRSENYFSTEDGGGDRYSQTGISLQSPGEAVNSSMEEKESSLVLRREDPGYDDVDLSIMSCHFLKQETL
ncbi:antigen WC1.1-like [Sus scrofa]|uniref:antigen WC1.1-like n=1 Tax=Sus scrofa TaxID=9823 RepID=UPI000A2B0898|nr:antigen WC1.1-like [Sus scrofa]